MNQSNKNLIKAAILVMSFVQMGTNGIAPILAQIAEATQVSASTVQFLMTFPSFFMLVFTLLCAVMSQKLPKKTLASTGLALVAAAGILAFFFHGNITILYVWGAVIGIGIGLVAPVAPSLVAELFEGNERGVLIGQQNSAANIGSMLMTFLGGFLAMLGWHFGYLVYLIAVPGLILTLIALPSKSASSAKAAVSAKVDAPKKGLPNVYWEMGCAVVFMILFNCGPTNLSLLVSEKGIGSSSVAGTLATIFLLGGVVAGLFYGFLAVKIGNYTASLGMICMAAGYVVMGLAGNAVIMAIGCLLAGFSVCLFMPTCMMAAARQTGQETLATAMVLASSNLGVFLAPVLTSLAKLVSGSDATVPRFMVGAVCAVVFAAITALKTRRDK